MLTDYQLVSSNDESIENHLILDRAMDSHHEVSVIILKPKSRDLKTSLKTKIEFGRDVGLGIDTYF